MRQNYIFTSESVSEGHPDKVCDRISDEIVDLVYREAKKADMDPWHVRVACETLTTTNRVIIAGEVRVPDSLLKKDWNGNVILDVHNLMIGFAPEVEEKINNIVGVVSNGLFAARPADILLLGTTEGVKRMQRDQN